MDTGRKIIFLVDDSLTMLDAGKLQLKGQYKVYPIPSAIIMFELLEHVLPSLILLDVEMPGMDGYTAIKRLKAGPPAWADIPVIFLTGMADEGSELTGLSLGAIDYIRKPFSGALLLKRIENHLLSEARKQELLHLNGSLEAQVSKKNMALFRLQTSIFSAVADMVEFRDNETGGHIVRTQSYLKLLVDQVMADGLYADITASWDMTYLLLSAQLHDIGKIGVSDLILNKPGRLTQAEYETMKLHVEIGVKALRRIEGNEEEAHSFLVHARRIAGSHHERWDGRGYPAGLRGAEIPLEGRLVAIADVYDALISPRPYKKPFSPEEARQVIEQGGGTHFDPALVRVFTKVADQFARVARGV